MATPTVPATRTRIALKRMRTPTTRIPTATLTLRPNITIGLPVLKSVARATRLPVDAHLMISEPGRYAEEFVKAGAQMVSVHVEADAHLHRTVMAIKSTGARAGAVINPATPVESLE